MAARADGAVAARTGSSPRTSTRSTSATARTACSRRRRPTSATARATLTLPGGGAARRHPGRPDALRPGRRTRGRRAERRRTRAAARCSTRTTSPRRLRARRRAPLPKPEDVHLPGTQGTEGQYFVNYVKEQLIERVRRGDGVRRRAAGDDDDRPRACSALAREAIDEVLKDPEGPSAALVAIDPRTGEVLAMVGGENYRESQFNLAAQAQAPAGLGVQAVRARRRARARASRPRRASTRSRQQIPLGRQGLDRLELRGRLPRATPTSRRRRSPRTTPSTPS